MAQGLPLLLLAQPVGRCPPADILLVRALGARQPVRAGGRGHLYPSTHRHVHRHDDVRVRGAVDRPAG